jgi:hypothetical protein
MDGLERLIESRIRKAQEEGAFDNLPGKGKPLQLDDDSLVPEDLKLAFKVLRNAGCLPIEMELRKEIYSLRQLLEAAIDPGEREGLERKLRLLALDLNVRTRSSASAGEKD